MSDPPVPVAVLHHPIGLQLLLFPLVHKAELTISVANIDKCLCAPAPYSGETTLVEKWMFHSCFNEYNKVNLAGYNQ